MARPDDMQPVRNPSAKLTYEDFLNFPDDGWRHKLIDGEHFVTPTPFLRHQRVSRQLESAIDRYLELHPIGEVFDAPPDSLQSPLFPGLEISLDKLFL